MTSSFEAQGRKYYQDIVTAVDEVRTLKNVPANHQVQAISLLTEYGHDVAEILETTRRINEDPSDETTEALLQLAMRLDTEARKADEEPEATQEVDMRGKDPREERIVITQSQTL